MKIVYYGSIFFQQKFGGISRYYYNLAKSLIAKDIDFKIVSSLYKSNYLKDLNKNYKKGIYFPRYPDLKIIKDLFRISNKLYIVKLNQIFCMIHIIPIKLMITKYLKLLRFMI